MDQFRLVLTAGGGAELEEVTTGELVWASLDDEDFMEEFPDFLTPADVLDVLDYLEEVGELTTREADRCQVDEESVSAQELAGMLRDAAG